MIYHFVKNIEIDVKANSLEEAKTFVSEIDENNACLEEDVCFYADDSFSEEDGVEYADVSVRDAEYDGCTDDEGSDPEEDLYAHLTEDYVYSITDKGRDYLDYLNGDYPEYDEKDYDEHGTFIGAEEEKDTADGVDLDDAVAFLADALMPLFLMQSVHTGETVGWLPKTQHITLESEQCVQAGYGCAYKSARGKFASAFVLANTLPNVDA